MPVEITNALSPELQAVADAREDLKKREARVDQLKLALKLAKDEWADAVGKLNELLDTLIETERQPTLFSRYRDEPPPAATPDDRNPEPDPPAPPAPETGDESAEILDADYEVNPDSVPSLPAASRAASEPGWRKLFVAEELDGSPLTFDRLDEAKVETLGQLADALLAGQTFDLPADSVAELKEAIRDASQEDAEPIRFAEDKESTGGFPQRDQFPDDKTGSWAFKHATAEHFGNQDEEQKRIDAQIADYRERQAAGGWSVGVGLVVRVRCVDHDADRRTHRPRALQAGLEGRPDPRPHRGVGAAEPDELLQ